MSVTNIADVRARKFAIEIAELEKLAETAVDPVTRTAILSLIETYRLLGAMPTTKAESV
jgi:hypothetical protein